VRTGAPAALAVLDDARFLAGDVDTHLLESLDLAAPVEGLEGMETAAAVAAACHRWSLARRRALGPGSGQRDGWQRRGRLTHSAYPTQTRSPASEAEAGP